MELALLAKQAGKDDIRRQWRLQTAHNLTVPFSQH
jgi:hypothetical protein